jgi:amino acid transporter
MTAPPDSPASAAVGLRRSLSLPLITFYGLGNILGAGIYVLIGKVVGHAGLFAPLSFLLASLLASLTAFSYAELSARFPLSAGEAVYVQKGLRRPALAALVGGLIVFAGCVSSATILRGFVGYLQVFVPASEVAALPLLILVLGGLAVWGITQSVTVAAAFTLLEIGGLLLIIAIGTPGLLERQPMPPDFGPLASLETWSGIAVGAFLAFYAFIGFEDMVNVAEEVRQPERNLPRAILWAVALSTLLYFAVALVAVTSLAPQQLAGADAPLALIYQTLTGREPVLITLIGMLAVINGALIQMIMASRVVYGMADRGWLPDLLRRVHPRTRTPVAATLLIAALVLLLAMWGTIELLAKATSYTLLFVFALTNLSLWRLKRREPHPDGVIRVPTWIPALGFLASLAVILVQATIDLGA